ncbi:carbohydrate-binding module family 20 domain-containing protein [Amycolatopsis magusensis]|uniref:carbohydrate-binding module family 20 domain-containing protein n=1 Tax=Amycolatopsis magusensis TaxID=882444 RepID=UPI003790C8D7
MWPLLTGERGEYELANGRSATTHLATMAASANPGYLIPEQVWDRASTGGFTFGEGTGSATPLAWSMAQFVRLAHSIDAGAPVETPSVVEQRYANGCANASANFSVNATTTWGQSLFVVGDRPELGSWNPANAVPMSSANYPLWTATVGVPKGTTFQYKYLRKEGGAVTWESGANRAATATGCTLGLTDTWRS